MLKTCLVRQGLEEDGDEGVKDLIEMTMKKMDEDKDGKVSFEDFKITVSNDPLMLEAFGPCLPRAEALHKFFQQVHLDTFPLDQVYYVIAFCNFSAGYG